MFLDFVYVLNQMNKMKTYFFLFIIFLFGPLIKEINGQTHLWTYNECIDFALKNNISVKQIALNQDITGLNVEKTKANRIPGLNFTGNQEFLYGRSLNPVSNTYNTANSSSNNFGLSANVLLFNGLQNNYLLKKYQTDLKANEYDLDKLKNDVTLNILNAYLQIILAQQQVESAKSQVQSSESLGGQTQRFVDVGKKTINDLDQVKSQLATDKYNLVTFENTLSLAKVTLMQLMELPVDSTFEVVSPVINDTLLISNVIKSTKDMYDTAMTFLPEIKSADLKIKSATYLYSSTKGNAFPRLTLQGNLNTIYSNSRYQFDPYFTQLDNNFNQSVIFYLTVPIFTNKQNKVTIQNARISVVSQKLTAQDTKNQLRKNIEQNNANFIAARNKFLAAREQLVAAAEAFKTANAKYNIGLMSPIDLLVQKNTLSQSSLNFNQAKYEYLFQSKIADFYLGRQISF